MVMRKSTAIGIVGLALVGAPIGVYNFHQANFQTSPTEIRETTVASTAEANVHDANAAVEAEKLERPTMAFSGFVLHDGSHNVLMANYLENKSNPEYEGVVDLLHDFMMLNQTNGWNYAGDSTWIQNPKTGSLDSEFLNEQRDYSLKLRAKVEELKGSENFDTQARYSGLNRK